MTKLSLNATTAIATYGVILHTGAAARREFCVAVVAEIVNEGVPADDVFAAAKELADYDGMEDTERALFRKQIQYCRAIAKGWKALGADNQRLFVGGGLPASSAVKAIEAKGKGADKSADKADETVKVSQPSETTNDNATGTEVITPIEMLVRAATYLDGAEASKLSVAEAKAIAELRTALNGFTERAAEQLKKAA